MQHISTTPFGRRPVSADHLERQAAASRPANGLLADKWRLFADLKAARKDFGLNDRNLAVLWALLSFHPDRELSGDQPLVVWPSNLSLSERANGIPESSLRRHLQRLVETGLIARQDSPNGKRYARKGPCPAAFGFSLKPLLLQADAIAATADESRSRQAREKSLRETISLLLRDAEKYLACQALPASPHTPCPLQTGDLAKLADLRREARRRLPEAALLALAAEAQDLLQIARAPFENAAKSGAEPCGKPVAETTKMNASPARIERHIQCSNKEFNEDLTAQNLIAQSLTDNKLTAQNPTIQNQPEPSVTLTQVIEDCPDIAPYAKDGIRDWPDLIQAAEFAYPMMGISGSTWDQALRKLGPVTLAIAFATMLQRHQLIRNPGAYLTVLAQKGTSALRLLRTLRVKPQKVDSCQLLPGVPASFGFAG